MNTSAAPEDYSENDRRGNRQLIFALMARGQPVREWANDTHPHCRSYNLLKYGLLICKHLH
jgi:hypothetical protein